MDTRKEEKKRSTRGQKRNGAQTGTHEKNGRGMKKQLSKASGEAKERETNKEGWVE